MQPPCSCLVLDRYILTDAPRAGCAGGGGRVAAREGRGRGQIPMEALVEEDALIDSPVTDAAAAALDALVLDDCATAADAAATAAEIATEPALTDGRHAAPSAGAAATDMMDTTDATDEGGDDYSGGAADTWDVRAPPL